MIRTRCSPNECDGLVHLGHGVLVQKDKLSYVRGARGDSMFLKEATKLVFGRSESEIDTNQQTGEQSLPESSAIPDDYDEVTSDASSSTPAEDSERVSQDSDGSLPSSDDEVHSDDDREDEGGDPEGAGEGDQLPFDDVPLPGSGTTVMMAIVLLASFVIAHALSWAALDDLLCIMNAIFGCIAMPPSKYLFRKLWNKDKASYFYYCEACETLLNLDMTCEICNTTYELSKLRANGCFFVIMNLRNQIQHLVIRNRQALHENLEKIAAAAANENINDITAGAAYRKLREDGTLQYGDLTITFNTDGSPLFKSSRNSIWPIQFIINELPPEIRFKHPTLAGLWFGKKHPKMTLFLGKFVEQFNSMEPLTWTHMMKTYHSKVYALCCCVDAPARAAVQNFMQFNSFFGCPWCLTKAEHKEGGMRYLSSTPGPERTPAGVIRDAQLAVELNTDINGVKGPSPLMNLMGFNIVWGYTVDYMHCVLQGVSKQITEFLFNSSHSQASFYIGRPASLRLVNKRLLSIRPPHCFTRLPRALSERGFWKASEWRLWLLFYSLPCTINILPDRYWRHLSKLSEAIYILLSMNLNESRIKHADDIEGCCLLMDFSFEDCMYIADIPNYSERD
ncbi:hypothetical protein HPB47_002201 [Ixodes persulcatus]|uniref:Uncharacterized protein n=1 Tax=Ixodes persulcatus TaxID=34615 RepID=A0AC60PMA4_IXOPE|nr:hypothetical protein HPB47_002201 [Ixodes persulcatus]